MGAEKAAATRDQYLAFRARTLSVLTISAYCSPLSDVADAARMQLSADKISNGDHVAFQPTGPVNVRFRPPASHRVGDNVLFFNIVLPPNDSDRVPLRIK